MRIQCERCSTTYELDESRLPPSGAPVQCTRCGNVFRAFPPGAADQTWLGQPPAPPPAAEPARRSPPSEPPPSSSRPAPAPPRIPAAPPDETHGDPGGDTTVTRLAARLRTGRRRAWMIPAALVAAAAVGGGTWLVLRERVDPRALELGADAELLLLRDDRQSVEQAAAHFGAAAMADPGYLAARADQALALLLLADDAADEARPGEARFHALDAERTREGAARAPGWESREAGVVARMRAAQAESQPARDRSRALKEEAIGLLRPLARERASGVAAARALAFYYALDGELDRATKAARAVSGGAEDPWSVVALATADLRQADAATRTDGAVAALERVVAAHPEMLRARLTLARALSAAGRRDAAVAALDAILASNGAHERAKALKAELLAPPPAEVAVVPAPPAAPPSGRPGNLPRLKGKH